MLQNEFPTVPDRDEDSGDPSDLLSDHFEHHLSSDKYNCVTVIQKATHLSVFGDELVRTLHNDPKSNTFIGVW